MSISSSLFEVRARLAAAERRAGRPPGSVKLLAVSKTKPLADIVEALAEGQRDFGENYAQELEEKATALSEELARGQLAFHFIGRLQSNKAKIAARHAAMVHTLDSLKLAKELDKRAREVGRILPVLVEVNVDGESSKGGVPLFFEARGEEPRLENEGEVPRPLNNELSALCDEIERLANLRLSGLMTIPAPSPIEDSQDGVRAAFRWLRRARDLLGGATRLPELSMGMSDDLEVAIEEGSTIVRVGTAIFGAREAR